MRPDGGPPFEAIALIRAVEHLAGGLAGYRNPRNPWPGSEKTSDLCGRAGLTSLGAGQDFAEMRRTGYPRTPTAVAGVQRD